MIDDIEDNILDDLSYSADYAEYIMRNCGNDRLICNGDMLLEAMEDGYLWDEFLAEYLDILSALA